MIKYITPHLSIYKIDWNMLLSMGHRLSLGYIYLYLCFFLASVALLDMFADTFVWVVLCFLYLATYSFLFSPVWLTSTQTTEPAVLAKMSFVFFVLYLFLLSSVAVGYFYSF